MSTGVKRSFLAKQNDHGFLFLPYASYESTRSQNSLVLNFFLDLELLSQLFQDKAQTALFKDPSPYLAVNTFHLGYKNQSFYGVAQVAVCSQIHKKHINTVWAERTVVKC
jgi:hypothetical protein